ncbi:MAG: tryptophan transporter [Epulopiscium sp.]|nr:tryptophan transporter [Candidatus Epulonipiscium sp.]
MNIKKSIITALLIAIGYILHQIVPGALGGMKFDIMLSMIFVALFINQDFKNTIITAILGGTITAMTTTFPGGQIPNIIDKVVTCIAVYGMLKATQNFRHSKIRIGLISFVGTIISGSVFLGSALVFVQLPVSFTTLFIGIVLPTSITNVLITSLIYEVIQKSMRVAGIDLTK